MTWGKIVLVLITALVFGQGAVAETKSVISSANTSEKSSLSKTVTKDQQIVNELSPPQQQGNNQFPTENGTASAPIGNRPLA